MRKTVFLIVTVLLSSCVKEEFHKDKFNGSVNLTPGVAVPVGYSHLEVEKYLKDSSIKYLQIANDGFLTLYYSRDIFNESVNDLLTLSPVTEHSSLINSTGSPINLILPGASRDITDSIDIPLSLNQTVTRIDSVHLLSGTLQMSLVATNVTGSVTFSFPGVLRGGNPYILTHPFSVPGFTQDLAGFTIIPEKDASGNYFIRCRMLVHLQNPSGPIGNGASIFDLTTDLISIGFETVYGIFTGISRNFPPVHLDLKIFDNVSGGSISLAEPQITLNFSNSCGVPLAASFSQLEMTDRNNIHSSVTGSGVPTSTVPKVINYPRLDQEGVTVRDSIVLDRTNSNIRDILSSNPVAMDIAGSGTIAAAAGNTSTFIRHDSEIGLAAKIKVPLEGKARFLVLSDTIAFDYLKTAFPVPEEIERLIVQLNIINSFPVEVKPQVYLLDENHVLLDSLLTGTEKIEGATDTNGDGKADPHTMDPIYIDLPRSKIDRLSRTHFLVTKGELTTTHYPVEDVRFYSTYFLDYNVGLIAQLRINTGKL